MLDAILKEKEKEIAFLKRKRPSLKAALQEKGLSVIAEIKRRSPSKGVIGKIEDPVRLAQTYLKGGASALSVLTEESAFGGSLHDLARVARAFEQTPVLRKDFILDPIQLQQAVLAGASAVLLIVAVLGRRTAFFLEEARKLGLEALVEVHNEEELQIALEAGAEIIGVNNRNLSTFAIDLSIAERLAPLIPDSLVKVAESGILTAADRERMQRAGYDAVLIGEALVKAAEGAL